MPYFRLIALALTLTSTGSALAQSHAVSARSTSPVVQMEHISVEVRGTAGTPVFFIPGLSSPRAAWNETVKELVKTHRVYLVQVNGFGGDDPRGNLKGSVLDGIVGDLKHYIDEHRLGHVAVVGHSMGGLVGLMLAARAPNSIERLMTVDALPYFAVTMAPPGVDVTPAMVAPQAAKMRDAVASGYGKPADPAAAEANVAGMTLDPAYRAQLKQWAMAADPRVSSQLLYEDLTTDMRAELASIQVPVTVVYAWNDKYPLKERADRFFRQNFTGLTKVSFVGVGPSAHFVMFDQPGPFRTTLREFLTK
jgi:pimeloyl-ACP methyl ester carboxylesterase